MDRYRVRVNCSGPCLFSYFLPLYTKSMCRDKRKSFIFNKEERRMFDICLDSPHSISQHITPFTQNGRVCAPAVENMIPLYFPKYALTTYQLAHINFSKNWGKGP